MIDNELLWTGERLIPSVKGIGVKEHLHRYILAKELVADKIVLDIASGEGYGSNILAENAKHVFGVDIEKNVITYASNKYKRNNLSFICGDVKKIPLDDSSIDVVVSFETLEHVYEQDIMFSEIKRILKKDGLLIISSPEKSNYGDINEEANHYHVKELYLKELEILTKKYFTNCNFIFQKSVYGSLIVPHTPFKAQFTEFNGNFSEVNSFNGMRAPVFNICIASDSEIPKFNISFFDAQEFFDLAAKDFQERINKIIKSKNYRLGKFILSPFRNLNKLFRG